MQRILLAKWLSEFTSCIGRYTPGRKGEHPQRELKGFRGHLYADGYGSFQALEHSRGKPRPDH